jgi:hypothetical protein
LSVGDLDAWVAKLKGDGEIFLEKAYRRGDTRALMIEGPSANWSRLGSPTAAGGLTRGVAEMDVADPAAGLVEQVARSLECLAG